MRGGAMRTLAAFVAMACAIVAAPSPADARKVLRLTIQLPLKSVLGQNVQMFKDEVEKATRGELEVQIFDSAQLYDDKVASKAVAAGHIDMAVTSLARFADDVPAVAVFQVPFLFDSDAKVRAATAPGSPVRGPLDEAIAASGARVLWWQAYGGTVLLTKGGQPVKSPADIKGRKVRVFGKLLESWVAANGGTPVNVSGGEQYFAYQRGTVDIGMTGPDSVKSRKLWEVMDTVTIANVANVEFLVLINEAVFQGLAETERTIVAAAARHAEGKLRDGFTQIEREALEAARVNKMTVYAPSAVEMQAFRKSVVVVRDEFLKASGDLGRKVLDAAAVLK